MVHAVGMDLGGKGKKPGLNIGWIQPWPTRRVQYREMVRHRLVGPGCHGMRCPRGSDKAGNSRKSGAKALPTGTGTRRVRVLHLKTAFLKGIYVIQLGSGDIQGAF